MKLRVLTIHNIASIAHAEINFDSAPLDSADVFLISGVTGAGKSTVLDSICLALYGTVPRLTGNRGSDRYEEISFSDERQLLRAGTGEGYARLTFRGNDGHEYDCRWAVRRSRNKPDGKFQKTERILIIDGDTAGAIVKSKDVSVAVESAVGVGYEQFVRTSMLAQGEFTRFLKADDREKSEILEKLTGASRYKEIGAEIFRRTSQCHKDVEDLQLRIDSAHLLSDEELSALLSESLALDAAIKSDSLLIKNLNERLGRLRRREALTQAIEKSRAALEDARKASVSDEAEKNRLLVAEYGATAQARENLRALDAATIEYKDSWAALQKLKEDFGAVLARQSRTEAEILRIEKVQALIGNYLKCSWHGDTTALEDACRMIKAIDVADAGSDAFVSLEKLKGEEKPCGHSVAEAAAILSREQKWLGRLLVLKGLIERYVAELNDIEQHKKEKADAEAEASKEEANVTKLSAVASTLAEVSAASRKQCSELDMAGKEWAKKARASLTPGCACPVCRQTVSVMPPVEEELAALWHSLRMRAEADAEAASKASADVAAHKALLTAHRQRISLLAEKIAQDETKSLKTKNAVTAEKTALGIAADDEFEEIIKAGETAVEKAEKDFRCATVADAVHDKFEECRQVVAEKKAAFKSLADAVESILGLLPEWKDIIPCRASGRAVAVATDFVAAVRSQYDREMRVSMVIERLSQLVDEFLKENPSISRERLARLAAMSPESIDTVRADLNAVRERLARAEAAYDENLAQLAELTEQTKGESDADLIVQQLDEIAERESANTRRHGAIGEILQQNEKAHSLRASLLAQLDEARERWIKWKRLDDMLGSATGDRFNRIAQSFVLKSLLEKANVYLRRLTGRYRLCGVDGTYLILLEDAYAGFRQRPVVTSSGGESFMVSLALALALADAGASFCCDTLFIDEGFGTLSGEPLQKAVGLLRTLYRRSGRRVGIISHVAELKDDIAVQIQVVRNPVDEVASIEVKDGMTV